MAWKKTLNIFKILSKGNISRNLLNNKLSLTANIATKIVKLN